MRQEEKVLQNIDWMMVMLYLVLVTMGWFNIYAAVYNESHQSIFDTTQSYGMQLVWILSSLFLAFIILIIDGEFFPRASYVIYGAFILLLIGVIFFGVEVKGSKSWIGVGSFRIQPAEFAKFATNLALAKFISNPNLKFEKLQNRAISIALFTVPALLVIAQNETGSALVFGSFFLVLYREGLPGWILMSGVLLAVLFVLTLLIPPDVLIWFVVVLGALPIIITFLFYRRNLQNFLLSLAISAASIGFVFSVEYVFENVLELHQKTRINVLLGKEKDLKGAGYNVNQSMIAIGSGGLMGKGFLNGTQTKFNYVPEQSTDFIFCTVGEEWGFIGSVVVLGLFTLMLLRIIYIAERQRSPFSRIYGYGLASIIFFHIAINIGMTIGLAPVVGIPLPFFSYGGSSLWSFTILLFIFLRLDAYRFQILR
jgi:rod shape determining protein RodA